ncbi:MAG: TonB-dependent receptor plug domain-containing protein [Cytophagales bacterium]
MSKLPICTKKLFGIAFLGIGISSALAQEVDKKNTPNDNQEQIQDVFEMSLEDLLNLAVELKTGSFLDLDIKSSPISLTMITKDQIMLSGSRHLSELLEIYVPGFQYMYNKWNGIIWGMRGVAADRNTKIVFLVNGHQMNHESRDGAMAELDLGLLGDIERVEVLRGPAGLTYGSGAIAGVVNVVTKQYTKDALEVRYSSQTWNGKGFNDGLEVLANKKINDKLNIAVTGGFRASQGADFGKNRIWGRGSWPYPGWDNDNPLPNGAPTAGSAWSTPGNYRFGTDINYGNFRVFSRFTNQVTNASGFFIADPWPEVAGGPGGSGAADKMIDGKMVSPDHPFWSQVEPWNTHKRQYVVKNWTNQFSYKYDMGKNSLKFDGGIDLVTNRIQNQLPNEFGFHNKYNDNDNTRFVSETFGEKRYSFRGVYNLNTIDNLKLAVGYQFRYMVFGKDMDGFNNKEQRENHIVVSNLDYTNRAIFTEGMYEVNSILKFGFGARYDAHTRTIQHGGVFTPKLAAIVTPNEKHSIKLIYQTSANNGSVDNYEFNRNSVNADGVPLTGSDYRFENESQRPGNGSNILAPVSQSDLHKLKPERSESIELAHVFDLKNNTFNSLSISYNTVSNLFVWNQDLFRVMNGGRYNFVNIEEEIKHASKKMSLGLNHTLQFVTNTNINQAITYTRPVFERFDNSNPNAIFYDSVASGSGFIYTPKVIQKSDGSGDSTETIKLYPISNTITRDGRNFLNMASNSTKLFFDFTPIPKWTFHANMRIFWGLQGRSFVQKESPNHPYLGGIDQPIMRFNMAVSFKPSDRFNIILNGYDLLAGEKSRHSFRWQQMAEPGQSDFFSSDLRSFGINIIYTY